MNPKYSCFKKTHSDGKWHGIEISWQWDGGHYGGCTPKQQNWHLIPSSELGDQADYYLRGNWWHLSRKPSMASCFTLLIKITLLWKSLSTPVTICSVKYIQLINIHTQISLHKDYRTIYMSASFLNVFLCLQCMEVQQGKGCAPNIRNHSPSLLCLVLWGRASQWDPEWTAMTSLAGQLLAAAV